MPSYNLVSKGETIERCRRALSAMSSAKDVLPEDRSIGCARSRSLCSQVVENLCTCVDLLLAPTKFVRDKMVDSGWNPQAVEVLPHFQRVPNESPTAPSIDAPILYFGRLSVEKGCDRPRARHALDPNIRLIYRRHGPQREELEAKAAELGLKNVEFAGHVGGQQLKPPYRGILPHRFPFPRVRNARKSFSSLMPTGVR